MAYTGIDAGTDTFTGVALGTGTFEVGTTVQLAPPVNNYNYDPLNQYYTSAIESFFNYYTSPHQFVLDLSGTDDTTFTGLQRDHGWLHRAPFAGPAGAIRRRRWDRDGCLLRAILLDQHQPGDPRHHELPAPPTWLTLPEQTESPSAMIFAANGVFDGTDTLISTAGMTVQKDVENAINSAFNRGLTPVQAEDGSFSNVIPPTYWANDPNPLIASATTVSKIPQGNTALSGTYYYAITSVNINSSDTPAGEGCPQQPGHGERELGRQQFRVAAVEAG